VFEQLTHCMRTRTLLSAGIKRRLCSPREIVTGILKCEEVYFTFSLLQTLLNLRCTPWELEMYPMGTKFGDISARKTARARSEF
jgi:hypothetical protein